MINLTSFPPIKFRLHVHSVANLTDTYLNLNFSQTLIHVLVYSELGLIQADGLAEIRDVLRTSVFIPFMEYPQGLNIVASITEPGIRSRIPLICEEEKRKEKDLYYT